MSMLYQPHPHPHPHYDVVWNHSDHTLLLVHCIIQNRFTAPVRFWNIEKVKHRQVQIQWGHPFFFVCVFVCLCVCLFVCLFFCRVHEGVKRKSMSLRRQKISKFTENGWYLSFFPDCRKSLWLGGGQSPTRPLLCSHCVDWSFKSC